MDHETISRKEKVEMARRQAGHNGFSYRTIHSSCKKDSLEEKEPERGYFFLRVLLSAFLLLAALGVTRFEAMGKQQAQEYQAKLVKVLKKQPEVEHIKELLKSVGK